MPGAKWYDSSKMIQAKTWKITCRTAPECPIFNRAQTSQEVSSVAPNQYYFAFCSSEIHSLPVSSASKTKLLLVPKTSILMWVPHLSRAERTRVQLPVSYREDAISIIPSLWRHFSAPEILTAALSSLFLLAQPGQHSTEGKHPEQACQDCADMAFQSQVWC